MNQNNISLEKVIKGLEHEIARTNIADLEWLDCVEVALLRDALALLKAQEQSQRDYESATEMTQYCERYEPTYNTEDGSL